ncbi:MAG: hypothetical protein WCG14_06025 [Chlamydiia bacterium]
MIRDAKIYEFTLPLSHRMPVRTGWMLHLRTQEGRSSWSEIAPLPGWSKETKEQALVQLVAMLIPIKKKPIATSLAKILDDDTLLPSVSFGLFSGLYSLLREDVPLRSLPLSGLLLGSHQEILNQIPPLLQKGVAYIKIKTSQMTATQTHSIIKQVKDRVHIRLDINKSWTPNELDFFCKSYTTSCFDYIEEPCCDLTSFCFPVALDESLRELPPLPLENIAHLKAIVIKPTLMGVGPYVQSLCKKAQINHWILSLSSSFESGIGLQQIGLFSEFFQTGMDPAGLDTLKFMPYDTLLSTHTVSQGHIQWSLLHVNIDRLQEVIHV